MANRDKERRVLQAKIAGAEARRADLQRQRRDAGTVAQEAALDLELLSLKQELKKLDRAV